MRLLSLIWITLWLAWLAFIVFIVTYPLSKFTGTAHWRNVQWIPFSHLPLSRANIFETTANVLIFIPLGYLTVRAWRRCTRHPVYMACLVSFLCSASAEFYQLFCHDRVPATTDLITNVTGGAIGGYMAVLISWHKIRGQQGDEMNRAEADAL